MTLDEFAIDHRGMAGRQPWSNAEALLDRGHIRLDVIDDLEAIGFQVLHPLLAAAATGATVDINCQGFRSLGGRNHEQRSECDKSQSAMRLSFHGRALCHRHECEFSAPALLRLAPAPSRGD
ncbi:hypothetical protein FQZ97_839500 [compost metagenome]